MCIVTLLLLQTTSYDFLNRVEVQNGCLALEHANLFIPSTLRGSNNDPETGTIHRERFVSNVEYATKQAVSDY